jgi:uncharacterized membrane protein
MAADTEKAASEIKQKGSDVKEKLASDGGGKLRSSLLSKEVVLPALATAGAVVAYAARKGASEAKEKAEGEAETVGGRAAAGAKKTLSGGVELASKAFGGSGSKKTRRLPIQRWIDVAAPVETVYERWTDFEEFPNFMHRVLNVERDDDKVSWDEKIWFSTRHWEGEITERRRNEKIAWKTTSGMAHAGVVTFHRLDKNLTRVMVDMDFVPQGMIEKMASGLRFVKRAVEADLARFKAYVELGEAKELEYHAKPEEREGDDEESDDENQAEASGKKRETERERATVSS